MKPFYYITLTVLFFITVTKADIEGTPANQTISGPQFQAFVERVESALSSERAAIIDSFMNAAPSFPFIESDTVVYFIYRGSGTSITVPGDANGWEPTAFSMTRLADTDFWYREAIFEIDARLDYKFVINGINWILDPRNPRQVSGGFGPNSELAMPEYIDPPEIEFNPEIPKGALHDTTFFSATLNNSRRIRIYTPPSYDPAGSDSFPVVLFHDGQEYLALASTKNTFDNLIAENRIQPLIGVFVPPVDRNNEYAFSKSAQFETFIIDELMPAIDERWRTKRNPESRAMIGVSFGGLISTQICYNNPEVFGLSGPFSPAYWPNGMEIFNIVANGPEKNIRFYMDWGTYEPSILNDGRALRDILIGKNYKIHWEEWHEGHSWGSWRAHLDIALEYFFPGPLVSIETPETAAIPETVELLQNFPNPFNPSTTIRYRLSQTSSVTLTIYDMLGQKIQTLVNETQQPGEKSVVWEGRDQFGRQVSSGVYVYRIEAGNFSSMKKMVLIR